MAKSGEDCRGWGGMVVVQCQITGENTNFGGVSFSAPAMALFCGTEMGLSGSLYLRIADVWQFALSLILSKMYSRRTGNIG